MTTGALQQFVYLHGKAPFQHPLVIGSGTGGLLQPADPQPCRRQSGRHDRGTIPHHRTAPRRLGGAHRFRCAGADRRAAISRFCGEDRVTGVSFQRRGRTRTLECDGVIFTGQFRPETALLTQSHLELDPGTRGP